MAIAGMRGTLDWGIDERPKNFREMILWRNPNGSAPLTALMSKMKTESVDDPEFSWWEEELGIVRVEVGAAALATDTVITLLSGGLNLVPGDILLVEKAENAVYDNELMEVVSVTNDTTITVRRGVAGSTAAAIAVNDFLTKVGSAFEEGAPAAQATTRNPTKLTNYCQIFKTSYEITNTAKVTRVRTGDPLKNDKKRRMHDHAVALEMAWLFGKPFEDTTGTKPKRYTGGLRHFIKSNVTIFPTGTPPTEDTFLDATYKVFDYDAGNAGSERLIFAGNGFLNSLNKLARNSASTRINFDGTIKAYGMELQRWILPQGTFYVRTHPLMNIHALYNNSAFIIDPSAIVYRPLRDTRPEDNIQLPGTDEQKGQWLTEAGLEIRHERTMAYLGNFVV